MAKKDLVGLKFNRLKVISKADPVGGGKTAWNCLCDCGVMKAIVGYKVTNGITKSCGCLQREVTAKRNFVHGERYERIYNSWQNMKSRCFNENKIEYPRYGGRGITVCDEWVNDFAAFRDWALINGYEENLTLDRTNNDGNYNPDNCRWVDRKTQSRNKRDSITLDYKGQTIGLSDLADEAGVNPYSLRSRHYRGKHNDDLLAGLPLTKIITN